MTTVSKNKRRTPGRPRNTSKLPPQSNTLTTIFAGTSIEASDRKARKKNKLDRTIDDTTMESEEGEWADDDEEMQDSTTTTTTDESTAYTKDQTPEKGVANYKKISSTEDESTTRNLPEDREIQVVEQSATPTQTNSGKKRERKRGTIGKKKPVQRTLFDKDTRLFKCINIFNTRFDISFRVPASDKPPEEVQRIIQEFLNACNDNSDGSINIVPWKLNDASEYPIIENDDQVPSQLSQLKIYFPRIRLSQKGSQVYTSIYLGHDVAVENLLTDISFWLMDSGFKLYKKTIQAENSAILGWFLYGIKEINTEHLQDAIEKTPGSPVVGLRQMRIRTSVTGKASSIRAMGIECDATQETEIKSRLIELYHSKQKYWPMGVKLRYMRDARFLCGAQAINKTVHLLGRHERFQEGIMVRRTRDLLSLDIIDKENKKSLRMILMTIKSKTKPSMSLFHSIDPAWNQPDTHNVTFLPGFEVHAEQVLSQLVPYVIYLEGEYVKKFFTAEALSKSEGCIWNEEKGCATSAIDTELDDIEMMDEEYDIGNPSKPSNILDLTKVNNNSNEIKQKRTLFGADDDSISTLGTSKANKKSGRPTREIEEASATSSIMSDLSLRTKSSIISTIQQNMEENLRGSIAVILREELARMVPVPTQSGNLTTTQDLSLTTKGSNGEKTNATSSGENQTGLEKEAGAA